MRRVTRAYLCAIGIVVGVVVVSTLAAACGRAGSPGQPGNPATQWPTGRTFLSTSVTQGGQDRPLVSGTQIRLTFDDADRLGAQAGCNHLGGKARLDGGRLVVTDLAMTEMACAQPRMDQDVWLSQFLGSTPTIALTGDELVLTSGDIQIRLTDRRVLDPDRALVGTRWVVDTILNGDTASSIPTGTTAYLVVDSAGKLTGSTGCTPINGTATVVGDRIQITLVIPSGPSCADDVRPLHLAMIAALNGEVTYRIVGTRLTLSGQGGSGLGLQALG